MATLFPDPIPAAFGGSFRDDGGNGFSFVIFEFERK
jgi:hypothetical protein